MPRVLPWRELGSSIDAEAADDIICSFKSHSTSKSNVMACSLCGVDSPHGMRYKLLKCESSTCSDLTCSWRGKVLLCFDTEETSIYELGEHHTIAPSPKRTKLTSTQKNFCRELAQQRLRPLRIQNALIRRFELPARDAPPLAAVQNFCNYYSRTELDNHDRLDELTQWIHAHAFTGDEDDNECFTFAWSLNDDGKPVVGDGSDEEPFIVGLATKTLLKRLELPPDQYVLHMDATFKMNTSDYPVVVVGISDRGRSFHLVALFVVSQREQPIYEACLASLSRMYTWITRKTLTPRYVMGDAEKAQRNAFFSVFHYSTSMQYLMCFFHVMTNVEKRLKGFPSHVAAALVRGLYDLHFARDQICFLALRDQLLKTWRSYSGLVDFCSYFQVQWLSGDFTLWQCYLTPSGFATTNNPTEQFNKVLKRDYTLRRRLKMGTLLKELKDCCRNESSRPRLFRMATEAAPALNRRSRELVREQLLVRNCEADSELGDTSVMHVVALPAKRFVVEGAKRSTEEQIATTARMGANYARMEVQNEPPYGWPVQLRAKWCPCNYCFKFGTCVHLLFALRASDRVDGAGRRILVSRRVTRKRGSDALGGRPCNIGSALSLV